MFTVREMCPLNHRIGGSRADIWRARFTQTIAYLPKRNGFRKLYNQLKHHKTRWFGVMVDKGAYANPQRPSRRLVTHLDRGRYVTQDSQNSDGFAPNEFGFGKVLKRLLICRQDYAVLDQLCSVLGIEKRSSGPRKRQPMVGRLPCLENNYIHVVVENGYFQTFVLFISTYTSFVKIIQNAFLGYVLRGTIFPRVPNLIWEKIIFTNGD